jgi:hypothetical protein
VNLHPWPRVRSLVDEAVELEKMRVQLEALGLTPDEVARVEACAHEWARAFGTRPSFHADQLVQIIAQGRRPTEPYTAAEHAGVAAAHLRALVCRGWLAPCARLADWLSLKLHR